MKLENGWWGTDLGKHRPCESTYELYKAESVPPLPPLDGTFAFLAKTDGADALAPLGVDVPEAFARFMGDVELQDQVPSCTACEWDLGAKAMPSRLREAKHTVRFLRDQQDCLFWYLLVGGEADGAVMCSPIPFDDEQLEVSEGAVYANCFIVAPTFEAFVWRFWMENVLWEILHSKNPKLDDAQQRYLSNR